MVRPRMAYGIPPASKAGVSRPFCFLKPRRPKCCSSRRRPAIKSGTSMLSNGQPRQCHSVRRCSK
ncbi:hypothetical protein BCR44DRAFT_1436260, partial [Catenaria anguillulae PL171]